MRKLNDFLQKQHPSGLVDKNYLTTGGLPNIMPISSGELKNVLFVDPVNGDDSNNGQDFSNAVKSLNAIENFIASNVLGAFDNYIFITGGILVANKEIILSIDNGSITEFNWIGTWVNDPVLTDSYTLWLREKSIGATLSDDAVVFDATDFNTGDVIYNFTFSGVCDFFSNYGPNWGSQVTYWKIPGKFVFKGSSVLNDGTVIFLNKNGSFGGHSKPTIDLQGSRTGVTIWNDNTFYLVGVKFINRTTPTPNNIWQTAILIHVSSNPDVVFEHWGMQGVDPALYEAYFEFYGFDGCYLVSGSNSTGGGRGKIILDQWFYFDDYSTGYLVKIMGKYSGIVKYDNSKITLIDTSTMGHDVHEYNGSHTLISQKTFLTKGIYELNGKTYYSMPPAFTSLPTSDPAIVGALWNNAGVVTVSAG